MYSKTSKNVDYGHGYPGYHWEVAITQGDRVIARANGPNTGGPTFRDFRDMDAVRAVRQLADGPIPSYIDIKSLLAPHVAAKLQ